MINKLYQNKVLNKYTRIKKIGKGNFGDVWLVEDNKGKQFALKRIELLFQTVDPHNEVALLKVLKHPNIIKYYESFVHNEKLCIIMEYAENSDLSVYIKNNPPNILHWFTQLCLAIQYLHSQNIIHRDIKLRNVFLTKDGIIKLGDFSISKRLDNISTNTSLGTPYYLSPEICQSKNYNHKTDIWNLGCFLYELCTQQKPFLGDSLPAVFHSIINTQSPKLPVNQFPKFFQDIISQCLMKDPKERPEVNQILQIPEIYQEYQKIMQMYRQKGIILLKLIECPQYQCEKIEKQKFIQLTPQYRSGQSQFNTIFSECASPNKKPYKKTMTINTQLDEKIEPEEITQKKSSFAKLVFNPKTPTSPNRNILLADFLKNKLGQEIFQKMKNILENSSDPMKLLDQRQFIADIIGEQNIDCIKIFKILISNSITPPSSHFRTMSANQFINQRNKTVTNQTDNEKDFHTSEINTEQDINTNAWDDKF